MKGFIKEFKEFALKGNVLDMAVGVIIGGAFGAIITSLVNDVLMPLIGILTGGNNIAGFVVTVGSATLGVGAFLSAVINFLIIALTLFIMIKTANASVNKFKKAEEVAEEAPVAPTAEDYLKEIRDILKDNKHTSL